MGALIVGGYLERASGPGPVLLEYQRNLLADQPLFLPAVPFGGFELGCEIEEVKDLAEAKSAAAICRTRTSMTSLMFPSPNSLASDSSVVARLRRDRYLTVHRLCRLDAGRIPSPFPAEIQAEAEQQDRLASPPMPACSRL